MTEDHLSFVPDLKNLNRCYEAMQLDNVRINDTVEVEAEAEADIEADQING
jgi:hypothetical protein